MTVKKKFGISFASLTGVLACVWFSAAAHASDIADLDRDQPTQLEDATPTAWGELQAELSSIFSRDDDDKLELEPSLDWGALKGLRIQGSVPVIQMSSERQGSGDIEIDALYLIPSEGIWNPDFAIGALTSVPTGIDSQGIDSEFKAILSQDLKGSEMRQRLHFNFAWLRNAQPKAGERESGYRLALGYQLVPSDHLSLVTDVVRQTEREAGEESNMVEGGALFSVGDEATAGVSLGLGIGDESPEFEARASIQFGI